MASNNHLASTSSVHELDASESDAVLPTYQESINSRNAVTSRTAEITDDGRVNVNLQSRFSRVLAGILPLGNDEYPESEPPRYHSDKREWEIPLNIVIQIVGSRGDIQPFIALGNELLKHGHRVRIATHDVFADFVRSNGLEFYPVGGNPEHLMAYMVKNPGLLPNMSSLRDGEITKKRTMVGDMLNGFWESCVAPDPASGVPFVANAIIANPPSFAHIHCAQVLGIPVHLMFTMPWTPTSAFPHPLANVLRSDVSNAKANQLSYHIMEWLTWQGLGDLMNDWRRKHDLEPVPTFEGPLLSETLKIPFTYCWSPSLVPKPRDWPGHIDVCGFFFRDPPDYKPSRELHDFLSNGEPPVYIGFGSIVVDDPAQLSRTVLDAVQKSGVRALVSKGWSKLDVGDAPEGVFFLGDCPHEWLFQNVSAVVHHGGAGTTACGLRYGRPTVVVPFFGDQPFWGNMIAKRGAGPKPIPYKELNSDNLAEAIKACFTPETREAAQRIADTMRNETGVKAAVASFHRHLPLETMPCDLIKGEIAAWSYKQSGRNIKMSEMAAEILLTEKKLERKQLKLHPTNTFTIDRHRWNILTSFSSAWLSLGAEVVGGFGSLVTEPTKEYKRAASTLSDTSSIASSSTKRTSPTAAAMSASADSLKRLPTRLLKGAVEVPVAVADGFYALPKMYGDGPQDHGKVTGWKSGTKVATKGFATAIFDSVTGFVVHPYVGMRDEGPLGFVKGVGKGTIGAAVKPCAAICGLAAYPLQGVYKSIHRAVHSKAMKEVTVARQAQGEYFIKTDRASLIDKANVLGQFDKLLTS